MTANPIAYTHALPDVTRRDRAAFVREARRCVPSSSTDCFAPWVRSSPAA